MGFTAEPFRCEDCEDEEQRQHGDLRRHKRRLGLLGGYRVQRGHLQERLDDPDENVEVERDSGADDVDPTPGASEVEAVESEDGNRQDLQGDDPDDV